MNDIVIRGAGGHAREVAFLIERINSVHPTWNLLGYIDVTHIGDIKYGYPVLGDDGWFKGKEGMNCAVAIGDPNNKYKVVQELASYHLQFPNIIDPAAVIAKDVKMGIGNIITGAAKMAVNSQLGNFCSLVCCCNLGHDVTVGDYTSVMNGAGLLGYSSIAERCLVGTNAVVLQQVAISANVTVGAGSIVLKNVMENVSVFGVPARIISTKEV